MSWDENKIQILKKEWGKGKTASQIAELIGGVSRNAVIGKAHRLKLQARAVSKKTGPRSSDEKNNVPEWRVRGNFGAFERSQPTERTEAEIWYEEAGAHLLRDGKIENKI